MANGSVPTVKSGDKPGDGMMSWMNDTQRGIAWFLVISFVLETLLWMLLPPKMAPESMAQLNQLVSTHQNILLIAIGFFFGSSKSTQNKDEAITAAALAPTPSSPPQTTTTTKGPDGTTTTVTEPSPGKTETTTSVDPNPNEPAKP